MALLWEISLAEISINILANKIFLANKIILAYKVIFENKIIYLPKIHYVFKVFYHSSKYSITVKRCTRITIHLFLLVVNSFFLVIV